MQTRNLLKKLNKLLESYVEVPRIRVGKKQNIKSLINEEALLLAKFLREEQNKWSPRVTVLN